MRDLDKIASTLFDKIRTRFPSVSMGDDKTKGTTDPTKGRFFNFDFVINGQNFGNITVSITDTALKIYFSRRITQKLDHSDRHVWYDFLSNLRHFAKSNMLKFDARDISRDHLTINDLKNTVRDNELTLESRQARPLSRIRVNRVTAEGRDYNKIKSIYVENSQGERFRLPINSESYARALVPHLESGGNIYDTYGMHVRKLVQEKRDLERFSRYGRRAEYLGESGQHLVVEAGQRSRDIGQLLKNLNRQNYYESYYAEHFSEYDQPLDENLVRLRELFVRPTVDPRVEAALPHLGRLGMVEQFEQWVDSVVEGQIEDSPDDEQEVRLLRDLFANEVPFGEDGINAIAALQGVLGNQDLEDQLQADAELDPDADARPVIYSWVENNLPDLLTDIEYQPEAANSNS
jgi:hypothetical protein